ncbi:MAG: type III polyketide synthase [Pelovirga sp.]
MAQIWLHQPQTVVPAYTYQQQEVGAQMLEWTTDPRDKRLVRMLYRHSGIDTRYSVIPDWGNGFFTVHEDSSVTQPTTEQRNNIYAKEASTLAAELGHKVLKNNDSFSAKDITHVVTASCTGFFNPGIDYILCRELGLANNTQRYHLGFMGCYAALPALNMAAQFCRADPDAVVLIMCLELCSLHLQLNGSEDSLLANSLFADGAAAALVTSRPAATGHSCRIMDFHSALIPSGVDAMAWSIGDNGFDISLSSYVPKIIGAGIADLTMSLLDRHHLGIEDIHTWAVHPGGKSIIDKVVEGLQLAPDQVAASRDVLRNYGNMSSATILFVLHDILAAARADHPQMIGAMAFGPGLTAELALLQLEPGDG